MEFYSVHHTKDEVELGLGRGMFLRMPAPPEGDDYDYLLLARFYGQAVDPRQFLLSARRLPAQERPVPHWGLRLVLVAVLVVTAFSILSAQQDPDVPLKGCKLWNTHQHPSGARSYQLTCAAPVPESLMVYPRRTK